MNHEVQRWRGLTTVENSSTPVGRFEHAFMLSTATLTHRSINQQSRLVIHNRATVVPQFFHRDCETLFASQPMAICCFTINTRRRIDSRAARFSTTAEILKL